MDDKIYNIFEKYCNEGLQQIIISKSSDSDKLMKVKIRPILLKQNLVYQAAEYTKKQVFHKNYTKEELLLSLNNWFEGLFYQVEVAHNQGTAVILISKKGKVTVKEKKIAVTKTISPIIAEHNRTKQYILKEGVPVPFLQDLNVMTVEGKIVKAKYDKYKQMNRFLEFLEDVLPELSKDRKLKIIDFGCGKSYLTFAMYYYLKELKGYDISIVGLDLKEEVIAHCNELAQRYHYDDLKFLHGDIAQYSETDPVDMVVTLHACDTATDYALYQAQKWGAKVILSVPCCQHELNQQIKCDELSGILKYGLIKERTAALFTDALRANMLEAMGYKVQILEFIDMEHTPKNILIRAIRHTNVPSGKMNAKQQEKIQKTLELLHVDPALYRLLTEERKK